MVRLKLTEEGELYLDSPFTKFQWEYLAKRSENIIDLTQNINVSQSLKKIIMSRNLRRSIFDLARSVMILQIDERRKEYYYIIKGFGKLTTYPCYILGLSKYDIKDVSKPEIANLIINKDILIHVDDNMNLL